MGQRHAWIGADGKPLEVQRRTFKLPGLGAFEVDETPADRAAYQEKLDATHEREALVRGGDAVLKKRGEDVKAKKKAQDEERPSRPDEA